MLIEKPMATILTSNGNSLRKRDLDTLQDNNRLNDVIIDTYLKMICDRSKNSSNLPKVFAFSTFFCQSIRRYHEYNRILSGFCKKEDLFSFDIIFVPVHTKGVKNSSSGVSMPFPEKDHWSLAVIDLKKNGIYYYDSRGKENKEFLKLLLSYLSSEHMFKKGSNLDTSKFEVHSVKGIPQQKNGTDCGMFLLKYAEFIAKGDVNFTFSQKDMPRFRKKMVNQIVLNRL